MQQRHPKILLSTLVAAVALAGLIVAGCGSSDSSSPTAAATSATTPTTTAASSTSGGAATIDIATNPDLGKILTDADGNTVYLFEKDENGMSNCSGGCAAEWPPVMTSGSPKAGSGADDSLLGTIKRDDGSEQVTYDDHPLYTYSGDTKPGDTNGNGLELYGAEWYAMTPDGSNAEPAGGDDSTSTDSTGEDSTSTSEDTSSGYSSY